MIEIKELDRKIKVPTVKSGKFNEWFNYGKWCS